MESDHPQTLDGALDANGKVISGNLAKVETDSGTLTDSQSGRIIVTSGNITIPTTTGFNVTLIAGGAHTVSFNSTTSAAMASGDIMSIVVQSSDAGIESAVVELIPRLAKGAWPCVISPRSSRKSGKTVR